MSPARYAESVTSHLPPEAQWYCPPHLAMLNRKMVGVATGEIRRQMSLQPPRTGKSEFRSKYFPAWYLGTYPHRRVILASYNADFAAEWGQKVRDLLERVGEEYFGIKVRQDRRASDNWGIVDHEGGMQTTGIGGSLTGRGAHLLLIDDPVKDAEDAMSPTMRQKCWDWYASAASTRLEPGASICLTMTPWHADDLGGRILTSEFGDWDILRFPAIAEQPIDEAIRSKKIGYDRLFGAPDPLGRKPGEALWPARYTAADYERQRRLDPFWFDALYGCHPRPRDGRLFKRSWFDGKIIAECPRDVQRVRAWDTAASEGSGDYTAGVRMSTRNGIYYVEHVERFRKDPGSRNAAMRDIALKDKNRLGLFPIWIEQPAGGGGKTESAQHLNDLAAFDVHVEQPTGGKAARITPFAAQCEAGNVKIVAGPWTEEYIDELCAFNPEAYNGKSDRNDQIDATSLAYSKLLNVAYIEPTAIPPAPEYDPIKNAHKYQNEPFVMTPATFGETEDWPTRITW
jgi:predicted phage terminase large subunit-like protein